jgi:predicted nuclease of predicted toxin-antitoxin system
MKFHLDENVDHSIATALRRRGIDVSTTSEANLVGASDDDQLAFVVAEERVIVTHDRDFLRLASMTSDHAGIVYCPKSSRSIGDIVRYLTLMQECLGTNEMDGQIEYL